MRTTSLPVVNLNLQPACQCAVRKGEDRDGKDLACSAQPLSSLPGLWGGMSSRGQADATL